MAKKNKKNKERYIPKEERRLAQEAVENNFRESLSKEFKPNFEEIPKPKIADNFKELADYAKTPSPYYAYKKDGGIIKARKENSLNLGSVHVNKNSETYLRNEKGNFKFKFGKQHIPSEEEVSSKISLITDKPVADYDDTPHHKKDLQSNQKEALGKVKNDTMPKGMPSREEYTYNRGNHAPEYVNKSVKTPNTVYPDPNFPPMGPNPAPEISQLESNISNTKESSSPQKSRRERIRDNIYSTVDTVKDKTGVVVDTVKNKTSTAVDAIKDKADVAISAAKEKSEVAINATKKGINATDKFLSKSPDLIKINKESPDIFGGKFRLTKAGALGAVVAGSLFAVKDFAESYQREPASAGSATPLISSPVVNAIQSSSSGLTPKNAMDNMGASGDLNFALRERNRLAPGQL